MEMSGNAVLQTATTSLHGNFLYFNQESPAGSWYPQAGQQVGGYKTGMAPSEALSLDQKIDDGKPFSGKVVQGRFANQCGISASNTYNTNDIWTSCYSYRLLQN